MLTALICTSLMVAFPPPPQAAKDESNLKGKLEGTTWIVTGGTIKQADQLKGIEYEFTKDGVLKVADVEIAKYSFDKGDKLNLDIKNPATGETKRDFTNVTFDGETMIMTDSDKTYVKFKKKPAKEKK